MQRLSTVICAAAMVAFVFGTASAQPIGPEPPKARPFNPPSERTSFTFEIGVGMAATSLSGTDDDGTHFGVAPWFSLGGFVTPRLALLARVSATTYSNDDGFVMNAFYGAGFQWWPIDRLFLGVSGGLAHLRLPHFAGEKIPPGFGANARIGVVVVKLPRSVFSLVLDGSPGFFPDRKVLGTSLSVEFQHL